MKDDNITMNERLAEMFGIPNDAFSATLRMRAGVPPILTVTRMIYRTGQLDPIRQHDRYRLVPVEKVGAGETAVQGDMLLPANDLGNRRAAFGASGLTDGLAGKRTE